MPLPFCLEHCHGSVAPRARARPAVGATELFILGTGQAVPPAGLGPCPADVHVLWVWSQVSHHPPSAAHYVFSKNGWSLWQEITISSKFRGKYLSIMPLGELRPHVLSGQKDILDKRKGFANPEASLGPQG